MNLVVFITASNVEEAERIGHALVDERLAACVNILPGITSIYRWKGKLETEAEVLLIAKTTDAYFPNLLQRAKELHSYEVPEVIALPVTDGNPDYLAWLQDSLL